MNQQSQIYPSGTAGHSRFTSAHAISSAFSASANPNEDWTKVSDLAERRRIQNRIAQRNYRKKLKRRLEDLERRAGSTSPSPEQAYTELARSTSQSSNHQQQNASKSLSRKQSRNGHCRSPEPSPKFERDSLFGRQTPRQLSASPPPHFSYACTVADNSDFCWTDPESLNYGCLPMSYADNAAFQEQYYTGFLPSQSLTASDYSQKEESLLNDDLFMNPFSMTYASMTGASMTGIDANVQGYMDFQDPNTPPLTEALSFGDSRESSPTHLAFPGTPFSMTQSPPLSIYGAS